jgi:DNA (cytosine-5)-methyltransferase 1
MFGLRFRRHRHFEAPCLGLALTPDCRHAPGDHSFDHGGKRPESAYRGAMGCDWMTVQESRQAIPPAYTLYLGRLLLAALGGTP